MTQPKCSDSVILDLWHPLAAIAETPAGIVFDTVLLEERVSYAVGADGTVAAWRSRPGLAAGAPVDVSDRVDSVRSYGGGVGYHMGRDVRLGFNIDQQHCVTEVSSRRYSGLRYGVAVTYGS